ncbi:MAG TPA: hypothetical protein VMM36_12350, partial [Opitutaceae bacterium]|nr:hypothetical protein [Opitutaceae bacterium]
PPVVKSASPAKQSYSGQPISLTLKDAQIRDVLQTFADITGLNIVADDHIEGTASVKFVAVPWDQALDAFLQQNGLTRVLEGNVLRIARLDALVAEKEKERRLRELTRDAR